MSYTMTVVVSTNGGTIVSTSTRNDCTLSV